jgi:hypothetical protein
MTDELPESPAADPETGEVRGPGATSFAIVAAFTADAHGSSRNGVNYKLKFEVQPGNADTVADMFTGDAPRLWWKPEGAERPTLISHGAQMPKYIISISTNEDAERHDTIELRLTAGDITMGVGVLLGPWAGGTASPVPGILYVEPVQQNMGF